MSQWQNMVPDITVCVAPERINSQHLTEIDLIIYLLSLDIGIIPRNSRYVIYRTAVKIMFRTNIHFFKICMGIQKQPMTMQMKHLSF